MTTVRDFETEVPGHTDTYRLIYRKSFSQIIATVVTLVLLVGILASIVGNENFKWSIVGEYFTAAQITDGIMLTLQLTGICMVTGTALGILLALMRISGNRLLSRVAYVYIWFFRATPLLVQLIFWFNISALYPVFAFGLPGVGEIWSINTNAFITPMLAAILCLSLNEAAYMAEVIRGGFLGVGAGQSEAAKALGMNGFQVQRVILPQATRIIVPPTANQLITLLKNTSLVSIVGIADLLHSAQLIYSSNYQTIPLLIVAGIWYLIITSVLSVVQIYLEKHFSKGTRGSSPAKRIKRRRPSGTTSLGEA